MIPTFAPPRQAPSAYPVLTDQPVCFHDLDPSGVVGRDAVTRWFETARLGVEREAFETGLDGGPVPRPVLSSAYVEILTALDPARRYRVGVGVGALAVSSYSCTYALFADDECVARGESMSVHTAGPDRAPLPNALPAPLPDVARARLAAVGGPPIPLRRFEPEPVRLVRDAYPFRVDVRARFGDLDTDRQVGNVALAGWYIDAIAELRLDVLGLPSRRALGGPVPGSLAVDYFADVGYPAIYQLAVGVRELDATSVHYVCGLFDGLQCLGLAEMVGVHSMRARPGGRPPVAAAGFDRFRMRR